MKYRFLLIFLALSTFTLWSCTKEGPGGEAGIKITVRKGLNIVPGADVYLAYGATAYPGDATGSYDVSKAADSSGIVIFSNLEKGNYWIYGESTDTASAITVTGNKEIKIKQKVDVVTTTLKLSE